MKFSGTVGETAVDETVDLEEVQAADAVQFPSAASIGEADQATAAKPADWAVWLSLALAAVAIVIAIIALQGPSSNSH